MFYFKNNSNFNKFNIAMSVLVLYTSLFTITGRKCYSVVLFGANKQLSLLWSH